MEKLNTIIKDKDFIKSLILAHGADVYMVGGIVRDTFLNKKNKDIDLVVRLITIDDLIKILENFGRVDVVGKSFGVIKFIADEDGLEYDIALPRKEKISGEGGYRGFIVNTDKNLSIDEELLRRDATINSIAYSVNTCQFIDPTNGLDDLKNKIIRATNQKAFSDDPLRMLRMIIFAARLDFVIEDETMEMIKKNVSRIKEIAGERILEELRKIIDKNGDSLYTADLLRETGLYEEIFGRDVPNQLISHFDHEGWENIKTLGEFIFMLTYTTGKPAEIFTQRLKGDVTTQKEILALNKAWIAATNNNPFLARLVAHQMHKICPTSLNSKIIPEHMQKAANELLDGNYPKGFKELSVNGIDLMELGLEGKEIGNTLTMFLTKIYNNQVGNSKKELLNLIK